MPSNWSAAAAAVLILAQGWLIYRRLRWGPVTGAGLVGYSTVSSERFARSFAKYDWILYSGAIMIQGPALLYGLAEKVHPPEWSKSGSGRLAINVTMAFFLTGMVVAFLAMAISYWDMRKQAKENADTRELRTHDEDGGR